MNRPVVKKLGHHKFDAIDINQNASVIAVVGFQIFKIFEMDWENGVLNSKPKSLKTRNIKYNTVQFSNNDQQKVAVGGNVSQQSLLSIVNIETSQTIRDYKADSQSINKVSWHKDDPNIILSCSQDGWVKLYDIRQERVAKQSCLSTVIRDIKFAVVDDSNKFVTCCDKGNKSSITLFDMRKGLGIENSLMSITTDTKQIALTLDWHPKKAGILACGALDKNIFIWDTSNKFDELMRFRMAEGVTNIKWLKTKPDHIAACYQNHDYSISVFDLSEPHYPKHCFRGGNSDVITGFDFTENDKHQISCSADGNIIVNPFELANPVIDIRKCNIAYQDLRDQVCFTSIQENPKYNTNEHMIFKNNENKYELKTEQKYETKTHMIDLYPLRSLYEEDLSVQHFTNAHEENLYFMERYVADEGDTRENIERNAQIAENVGKIGISNIWRSLEQLFLQRQVKIPKYNEENSHYMQKNYKNQNNNKNCLKESEHSKTLSKPKETRKMKNSYNRKQSHLKVISENAQEFETSLNDTENQLLTKEECNELNKSYNCSVLSNIPLEKSIIKTHKSHDNKKSLESNSESVLINTEKIENLTSTESVNQIIRNIKNDSNIKPISTVTNEDYKSNETTKNEEILQSPLITQSDQLDKTDSDKINKPKISSNKLSDSNSKNDQKDFNRKSDVTKESDENLANSFVTVESVSNSIVGSTTNIKSSQILQPETNINSSSTLRSENKETKLCGTQPSVIDNGDNSPISYDTKATDRIVFPLEDNENTRTKKENQKVMNYYYDNPDELKIDILEGHVVITDDGQMQINKKNQVEIEMKVNNYDAKKNQFVIHPNLHTISDCKQFSKIVLKMVQEIIDNGEFLHAYLMYRCLSKELDSSLFSEELIKNWETTYIDILSTENFFQQATEVIKNSKIESIRIINQNEVFFSTRCGRCNSRLQTFNNGRCDPCKDIALTCSLCRQPVKGLALICQICGHGGHMKEMREYWGDKEKRNRSCPCCIHNCFDSLSAGN